MNENITYCTKCGSTLLEEDKFCASCGSEVRQRPSAHKHPDPAQTAEEHSDVSVKDKDDNARTLREETEEENEGTLSVDSLHNYKPRIPALAKIKNRGITRLPYYGLSCIGGVIPWFMGQSLMSNLYYLEDIELLLNAFSIISVYFVIQIAASYFRIKNTGLNPLLSLLLPIPIEGIYVVWLCYACQEDYADTRSLDNAGFFLTCLLIGFCVLGAAIGFGLLE